MHRLIEANYFDGQTVRYSYTPTDLRETVTDARGAAQYSYDQLGRLLNVLQSDGRQVSYTYDRVGNRSTMTTPAGTITYSYDQANQLVRVIDPQQAATTFAYDNVGMRTQRQLPNGVSTTYTYDTRNRLTALAHTKDAQTLATYTYTLEPTGQRRKVIEMDGTAIDWTYDAAGQLIAERLSKPMVSTALQTSYTYDAVGNRLSQTLNGVTTQYTYNLLDQLVTAGATQYTYDGRGNLTQIAASNSSTNLTYNARNQQTAIQLPDGTGLAYGYDADGRRVQQVVNGSTTNYLWDESSVYGDVVFESDASGGALASYVLGNTELVAQRRNGATSYYLQDGQGSVRALTDATGAVTDQYRYDAFGQQQEHTGTSANVYRYAGQQFDPLTGLYSLRARYYNPESGRFLNRDMAALNSFDPTEWNRYTYARRDPVNFADPLGLEAIPGTLPQPATQTRAGGGPLAEYGVMALLAIGTAAVIAGIGQATFCKYSLMYSFFLTEEKDGPQLLWLDSMVPPNCIIPIARFPGLWQIQAHILAAQYIGTWNRRVMSWIGPQRMRLTYRGVAETGAHPRPACRPNPFARNPPGFTSCDEYPFASTFEGGHFFVSIMGVDPAQNSSQGGRLVAFYTGTNRQGLVLREGDIFAALGI